MIDRRYLEEKLRAASVVITDSDRPVRERLRSAHIYGLTLLTPDAFSDPEDRAEFVAICEGLNAYGEAREGGGSLETTLGLMDDGAADDLAQRIVALAGRYGQA
jgi:hypothetical protein